jgi:hypothetical protein
MKQRNRFFLILAVLVGITTSTVYSQSNWQKKILKYRPDQEWCISLNGGIATSVNSGWSIGGNITKNLSCIWSLRAEGYINFIESDDYSIGKCAFVGVGPNFSLVNSIAGYKKERIYDLYLSSCLGFALDNRNDLIGHIGLYGNFGLGLEIKMTRHLEVSIEDKLFVLSSLEWNKEFFNNFSVGVIYKINPSRK